MRRKQRGYDKTHEGCVNEWEYQVYQHLGNLKETGRYVIEFRHAFRAEEPEGKDFFVRIRVGGVSHKLWLQVKRNPSAGPEHCGKYPNIPCIIVSDNAPDEGIDKKLVNIFERWLADEKRICV